MSVQSVVVFPRPGNAIILSKRYERMQHNMAHAAFSFSINCGDT